MDEVLHLPVGDVRGSRAAQYVRMSTDQQKYSTENQAEAIAAYAERRNLTIVRTYSDQGLSGLGISWRDGLKSLIADVEGGRADFDCVLVYDVTRWGRFQNVDESAYYEFICQRAGITIHYCEDEFENDGSLASVILKNVKRVGAADFSRQLSKKVFLGQSRIVRMGFWRGGMPGYGLRRQLIEESGAVRQTLEHGQQKYLHTDRIRIIHGPEAEVDTVRRMFRAVAIEGKYLGDIAAELNAQQIRTSRGTRWSGETVGKILANEAYTGSLIFNRASFKLKQKRVDNPREMWIRHDEAFPAVVSSELFTRAQEIMRARRAKRSDQEVIDRLAALGREKGHLSTAIIAAADGILSAESYRRRFGSLVAAYALAGYQPEPRQRRAETTAKYRVRITGIAAEIAATIKDLGGAATLDIESGTLRLADGCRIAIGSARAITDGAKRVRWKIHANRRAKAELTLILRMNPSNDVVASCYLLPTYELAQARGKILRITNPVFAQACRFDSVDAFCRLCVGFDERWPA
ncbi:recombinase family protein [Bradyrhizobium diazoefficiens]|uniref:recombinase family protein n=1 Tax=Bradyrhizobium diazoefficiens TaxID=1355477 RepID=UPI00190E1544|nr:recombinase family protein [Bradyrhizobium diazoefficiens]MBK3665067.1 recombinase family protein [Bradyrhizobium diazoefficiens]